MSIEKTEAISLGAIRLGDTSQIVTFLTSGFGLIKCVAKGSRSKRSKYGGALEPFMLSSIVFYHHPRRELFTLSQADVRHFFPNTRSDLLKTALAQIPVDLLRQALLPADREGRLFDLAQAFLMELEDALEVDYAKILLGFWLGFCEEYGFGTDFRGCRLCGKATAHMYFHAKKGCVFCADCSVPVPGRQLPPAVFEMLHCAACSLPWCKADHAGLLQALHLLADYLSYHSHKDLHLRSIRFFEALQAKSPSPMAHR